MPDAETQVFEVPATEPGPVSYEYAERRIFGLAPHTLTAVIALCVLEAALALLVAGHAIAGSVLLAPALLLGALYAEQVRPRRGTAVGRGRAAIDNARAVAGSAAASVHAWASAGRRVVELRFEARGLARDRSGLIAELGAATYDRNDALTAELRGRIHGLDLWLEACAAESCDVLDAARSRTAEERLAVRATRSPQARRGAE